MDYEHSICARFFASLAVVPLEIPRAFSTASAAPRQICATPFAASKPVASSIAKPRPTFASRSRVLPWPLHRSQAVAERRLCRRRALRERREETRNENDGRWIRARTTKREQKHAPVTSRRSKVGHEPSVLRVFSS